MLYNVDLVTEVICHAVCGVFFSASLFRSGVITNIAKSLDILRQNLQSGINKEIAEIIRRYSDVCYHVIY